MPTATSAPPRAFRRDPAPAPWTAGHDGHGGVCLTDAAGCQIGYISRGPHQDASAALCVAAPALAAELRATADWLDERAAVADRLAAAGRRLRAVGEPARVEAVRLRGRAALLRLTADAAAPPAA